MTLQYNVPIKIVDVTAEFKIDGSFRDNPLFYDPAGKLFSDICFSREYAGPYVGAMVVLKTLRKEVADKAYHTLRQVGGLIVLPVSTSDWEKDRAKVGFARQRATITARSLDTLPALG